MIGRRGGNADWLPKSVSGLKASPSDRAPARSSSCSSDRPGTGTTIRTALPWRRARRQASPRHRRDLRSPPAARACATYDRHKYGRRLSVGPPGCEGHDHRDVASWEALLCECRTLPTVSKAAAESAIFHLDMIPPLIIGFFREANEGTEPRQSRIHPVVRLISLALSASLSRILRFQASAFGALGSSASIVIPGSRC